MAVAGIAGAFSLLGTVAGVAGSFLQYKAGLKAEKARQQQMKLEAQRARREQIRRSQVSRAQATAAAVNQGAGNSSALEGGKAQIANEANRNILAITQDEALGNKVFKANRQMALGGMISSLGQGISSLGGAFASNAGTITRLGAGGTGSNIPFYKNTEEKKGWSLFG